MSTQKNNQRILLIDDNPSIHQDFRKVLGGSDFTDSAYQGQEGLAKVEQAIEEGRPYSVAFVDVRMPPGWDGIETVSHIWKRYPELQVVICTAYSDYSWDKIVKKLGQSDSLLILKKP